MLHRRGCIIAWGGALALSSGAAFGQGDTPGCSETYTLPAAVTVRPLDLPNPNSAGPADPDIAIGFDRIVCVTNGGVNIRCTSGGPRTEANVTTPLYGSNASLDSVMFQQTPELADDGQYSGMGDTRVIYDAYADRFWLVSAEYGLVQPDPQLPSENAGRLHLAVSKTDSPDNAGTGAWYKYTYGGNSGSALDPQNIQCAQGVTCASFVQNAFPDVPTIMVDQTYLYLCVREGGVEFPVDPTNDRMLMIVFRKDKFLAGNPADPPVVEKSKFIDDIAAHPWGHALAVDADITGSGKAYLVSLPSYPDTGKSHPSIRFGAFYKATGNPNSWTYSATNLTLPTSPTDYRFRGVSTGAPGGDGDTNALRYSIFRGATTRRMGSDRKVWAAHHVRPQSPQNDTVARLQFYRIDPHDYPNGTPVIEVVKRLNLSPAWAHDPGLGVNSCGDLVMWFTKSVGSSGYPEIWLWAYPETGQPSTQLVLIGPDQYYTAPGQPWADFAAAGVDPNDDSRFLGHHIAVYPDRSGLPYSAQWQSHIGEYFLRSCGQRPQGPDLDGDGEVGLADLLLFQRLYERGEAPADYDGNGEIDAFDFLQLLLDVQDAPR